ncbi:MAG: Rpn family recombination-promoting nuclease/putative transposase [Caldilineaceae bacterium]
MSRYIDLRTDFGFKRLFGREDSKDILKQFLFDILELTHPIQDLTYIPVEQLGASPGDRRGVYDVYCTDAAGQRFIVEMQQVRQVNIKESALYYSTFAINYQARRGSEWQFNLLPVYCIAVLDFSLIEGEEDDPRYFRRVQLADCETNQMFYDKLTFIYIELTKFNQPLSEATAADKWIYLLKNLPELQNIPAELATEPFTDAFAIAEEAALSPEERYYYEGSLKHARDINAQIAFARQEGREEALQEGLAAGREEQSMVIVRAMAARGLPPAEISALTGIAESIVRKALEGSSS